MSGDERGQSFGRVSVKAEGILQHDQKMLERTPFFGPRERSCRIDRIERLAEEFADNLNDPPVGRGTGLLAITLALQEGGAVPSIIAKRCRAFSAA